VIDQTSNVGENTKRILDKKQKKILVKFRSAENKEQGSECY